MSEAKIQRKVFRPGVFNHEGFTEFEIGQIAYFNGQKVKLLRLAQIDEERIWRVKDEDGMMYNVPVDLLHLLSSGPSGNPAAK